MSRLRLQTYFTWSIRNCLPNYNMHSSSFPLFKFFVEILVHVLITTRGSYFGYKIHWYKWLRSISDLGDVLRYRNGKCVILGLLGFMVSGTISMTCTIERSLTSCFMAFLNYCTAVRFILRTYRPNEFWVSFVCIEYYLQMESTQKLLLW